jgi:hypothetical protein
LDLGETAVSVGWSPEHDGPNWVDDLVIEHGGSLREIPRGRELQRQHERDRYRTPEYREKNKLRMREARKRHNQTPEADRDG